MLNCNESLIQIYKNSLIEPAILDIFLNVSDVLVVADVLRHLILEEHDPAPHSQD